MFFRIVCTNHKRAFESRRTRAFRGLDAFITFSSSRRDWPLVPSAGTGFRLFIHYGFKYNNQVYDPWNLSPTSYARKWEYFSLVPLPTRPSHGNALTCTQRTWPIFPTEISTSNARLLRQMGQYRVRHVLVVFNLVGRSASSSADTSGVGGMKAQWEKRERGRLKG